MANNRRKSVFSILTPAAGKAVRAAARLRGGGTAFPGKVVQKIDPQFLSRMLEQLPCGTILVSGTNGKTTTARIVASLLENIGYKVFTNPTGSNFTRGVVSALIDKVSISGRLDADIAVLELDEAYAVHFVKEVKPQYCLLLNVMRDQLDRFGEIDNTARLLSHAAAAATETVVLNREDSRIARLSENVRGGADVQYYGLSQRLRKFFPADDEMYSNEKQAGEVCSAESRSVEKADMPAADVILSEVDGHKAVFEADGEQMSAELKLEGVYNLFNAAGALATVRAVLRKNGKKIDNSALIKALSDVTPAFGRGESIEINGTIADLILVKNPMGFRLSLSSFDPKNHDTMIVINDQYADGRDMSWLWDVDFSGLAAGGVSFVSGTRATDMALRLAYDGVKTGSIEENIESATEKFANSNPGTPKRIYCTYTAMLAVRAKLAKMTSVEDAGL